MIPSVRRGFFYPTTLCSRCPMYHGCTITKKCQNYDRHNPECQVCESRVIPPTDLGGLLPEGEFIKDAQAMTRRVEEKMGRRFGDPNADIVESKVITAYDNTAEELAESFKQLHGVDPKISPYGD